MTDSCYAITISDRLICAFDIDNQKETNLVTYDKLSFMYYIKIAEISFRKHVMTYRLFKSILIGMLYMIPKIF